MELQHNEYIKYINEQKGLKAYLIGQLGTCWGYDEQTRKELIEEYLELMEAAA